MTASIKALSDGLSGELQVGGNPSFRFGADTSGQLAGFRNRVINGCCRVAQRGNTALAASTLQYGAVDRILNYNFGFTTISGVLAHGGIIGNSVSVSGFAAQQNITTTGTGSIQFRQRIESYNSVGLNSKTITISLNAQQDTGVTQQFSIDLYKANTQDNFAATTNLGSSSSFTVPHGTKTRATYTLTLGSADATNGLEIIINWTGIGAVTGKSFYVADLQLEEGSIATPFEHRPYGLELSLCQRYYEKSYEVGTVPGTNTLNGLCVTIPYSASISGSTAYGPGVKFLVPKRAAANCTIYSAIGTINQVSTNANFSVDASGGTAVQYANNSMGFIPLNSTTTATMTGNALAFHWTASAEL